MEKTIVFCADGTWNGPGQDDDDGGDGDRRPDPTNVCKLFRGLEGELAAGSMPQAGEQEKELRVGGRVAQVAKYLHGVGDSRHPINRLLGGAFGAGVVARIVRGYTFISRNYCSGDSIVIVGFSRGAYTARALAGLIASQGLLARRFAADREGAYRAGAQAWHRWRRAASRRTGRAAGLAEAMADLPAFVSSDDLTDADFVAVDSIAAVAVWDTVGTLGLPDYLHEPGGDAFKFTDTALSRKVVRGFHAVALDEQRRDFAPTLWDPAPHVVQFAFPGAHSDVGGGYPATGGESGLSDIALEWMAQQLRSIGVRLARPVASPLRPDPLGVAHKPWLAWPFDNPARIAPRRFAAGHVQSHPSIEARCGKVVAHDPSEPPAAYWPLNWQPGRRRQELHIGELALDHR